MLKIAFPMRKVVFPKNGPKKGEGFQKKGRGWNWINKELLKEFQIEILNNNKIRNRKTCSYIVHEIRYFYIC